MLGGIERDFARNRCWIITQLCDHFAQNFGDVYHKLL